MPEAWENRARYRVEIVHSDDGSLDILNFITQSAANVSFDSCRKGLAETGKYKSVQLVELSTGKVLKSIRDARPLQNSVKSG